MQSDIDLLAYMVRWRYLTAPQVVASGPMAGLSLASAYKRLGRLQGMGLVVQHRPLTDAYALWIPTLAAYDLVESPLYPEIQVVLGSLRHTLAVTDVAALYERAGHMVRSEREIAQALQSSRRPGRRARAFGATDIARLWMTLPPYGQQHAPDLVISMRSDNDKTTLAGIEVELSTKPVQRIGELLRGYQEDPAFSSVTYWVRSAKVAAKIGQVADKVLGAYPEHVRIAFAVHIYSPRHSTPPAKRIQSQ